nr:formin-2-like [Globicephala melas]
MGGAVGTERGRSREGASAGKRLAPPLACWLNAAGLLPLTSSRPGWHLPTRMLAVLPSSPSYPPGSQRPMPTVGLGLYLSQSTLTRAPPPTPIQPSAATPSRPLHSTSRPAHWPEHPPIPSLDWNWELEGRCGLSKGPPGDRGASKIRTFSWSSGDQLDLNFVWQEVGKYPETGSGASASAPTSSPLSAFPRLPPLPSKNPPPRKPLGALRPQPCRPPAPPPRPPNPPEGAVAARVAPLPPTPPTPAGCTIYNSAPIPGLWAGARCRAALIVAGISAPPRAGGDKFSLRKLGGTFSKTPRPREGETEPLCPQPPPDSHQAAQVPRLEKPGRCFEAGLLHTTDGLIFDVISWESWISGRSSACCRTWGSLPVLPGLLPCFTSPSPLPLVATRGLRGAEGTFSLLCPGALKAPGKNTDLHFVDV